MIERVMFILSPLRTGMRSSPGLCLLGAFDLTRNLFKNAFKCCTAESILGEGSVHVPFLVLRTVSCNRIVSLLLMVVNGSVWSTREGATVPRPQGPTFMVPYCLNATLLHCAFMFSYPASELRFLVRLMAHKMETRRHNVHGFPVPVQIKR